MPKTAGEINASKVPSASRPLSGWFLRIIPLEIRNADPYLGAMNYILALLLPPLSILLTGRPILAIIVFVIWIPALFFSGGLTHPMFILLAWALIFHAREDRRQRF
ncbi:hypothetical protein SAMN05443635_11082 [Roseobacter denitrificans OCh 114]|uniref:Uncharacterized protein n=2 Tax=Roseobacter denitrificans TaxID=2434 RepID=Q161I9_ROSDO|nr:hypothetical protein RD1_3894 [Roseobacter denitrificans OCh 114]SFG23297.1 hypothetical protein SAMN05443635_11082 [Roseobacter denitrificans OCh 114]